MTPEAAGDSILCSAGSGRANLCVASRRQSRSSALSHLIRRESLSSMALLGYMAPMALALLIPGSLIVGAQGRERQHAAMDFGTEAYRQAPHPGRIDSVQQQRVVHDLLIKSRGLLSETTELTSTKAERSIAILPNCRRRGERARHARGGWVPPPALPGPAGPQLLRGARRGGGACLRDSRPAPRCTCALPSSATSASAKQRF